MKKIFIVIFIVGVVGIISGCGQFSPSKKVDEIKPEATPNITEAYSYADPVRGDLEKYYVFVDPDTGVNYLLFKGQDELGVIVRLNADGKPMITKK